MKVNITLAFKGNCEEALTFYSKVFNKEPMIARYKDMPQSDGPNLSEEEQKKVIHSELKITENTSIMASDDIMKKHTNGSSTGISLNFENTEDLDAVKKMFEMLSEGGDIIVPLDKTFWNAYYGAFIDKFGVWWQINYSL